MSLREEIRALPTTPADLRKFGWLVGAVLAALGGLLWWRGHGWAEWMTWIGVALVVLGTVLPRVLKPVYLPWMVLALAMGFVMTRVILSIFFALVLIPVGLLFKVIRRDALHRKLDRAGGTYWIPKEYPIRDRTRLEKFF